MKKTLTYEPKVKSEKAPIISAIEKKAAKLLKQEDQDAVVLAAQHDFQGCIRGLISVLQEDPRPERMVEVREIMKRWTKALEDNGNTARELLLEYAKEHGQPDEEGSLHRVVTLKVGDADVQVKRQVTRHSKPDEGELRKLMKAKKIKEEEVFSEQISTVLDETKLDALVQKKRLTDAELDACRKVKATQLVVEGL